MQVDIRRCLAVMEELLILLIIYRVVCQVTNCAVFSLALSRDSEERLLKDSLEN